MEKLIVASSIEIAASPSAVWKVLTNPERNREWIRGFWPEFEMLHVHWKTGAPMEWRVAGGEVGIEGKVLAVRPNTLLQYSFTEPSDIVTFTLEARDGGTVLSVSHGDFRDKPDGEACYRGALEGWALNLPAIKALAEDEERRR